MNFAGPSLQCLTTRKILLFLFICLMLIPFINLITLGKVKDSVDNVEQWMNVANAVFLEDQTFIFSYGPLFWLVTRVSEYYNAWNYYLSISFLIFFYSFVIYLIFSLLPLDLIKIHIL